MGIKKKIFSFSLKQLMFDVFEDEKFLSLKQKDCLSFLRENSDILINKWKESDFKDFSIYKDDEYISELFICYYYTSRIAINNMIKFFRNNIKNYKELSYLDDYNGIGLTTLNLLKNDFKNIHYRNNIKKQVEIFKDLCKKHDIKNLLVNDKNLENKYDVVISLEISEHYKKPLDYIKEIKTIIKPGGYLVYSSGFGGIYGGHFPTYEINGDFCSIKSAGRKVNKFIKQDFEMLYKFWNAKPTIYKKGGVIVE